MIHNNTSARLESIGTLNPAAPCVVWDTSKDGNTIVGGSDNKPFRWDRASGIVAIPFLAGHTAGDATCVSRDGTAIAGSSQSGANHALWRWTPGGGTVAISSIDALAKRARGMSNDGTIVVGFRNVLGGFQAIRWTSGTGLVDLPLLAGGLYAQAYCISGDGLVIGGVCKTAAQPEGLPVLWTDAGATITEISLLSGFNYGFVYALSADGSVATGHVGEDTGYTEEGFRWVPDVMSSLGPYIYPHGISKDGRFIIAGDEDLSENVLISVDGGKRIINATVSSVQFGGIAENGLIFGMTGTYIGTMYRAVMVH